MIATPLPKSDLRDFKKYGAGPGTAASYWILAHFALVIPMISHYEAVLASLPPIYRWTYLLLLCYTLYIIGAALQNKTGLLKLEILRWLLVGVALVTGANLPEALAGWSGVYLVVSAISMLLAIHIRHPPVSTASQDPGEKAAGSSESMAPCSIASQT